MSSSTIFLVLSIFVVPYYGKLITVKNGHSTDLVVSVDGTDYTIATNAVVPVELADEWSGSITAVPVVAEVLNGPKTKLKLFLSASGDSYYISLLDGFNLPAKIVPKGNTSCIASTCKADILKVCPVGDAITNSTNRVVACKNSPLVMATVCPMAVVNTLTSTTNVQYCATASSYLIVFT